MRTCFPIPLSRKDSVLIAACFAAFGLSYAWARSCDDLGAGIVWCICVALWTITIAVVRTSSRVFHSSMFGICFTAFGLWVSRREDFFDWGYLLMVVIFFIVVPAAIGWGVTKIRNDGNRLS